MHSEIIKDLDGKPPRKDLPWRIISNSSHMPRFPLAPEVESSFIPGLTPERVIEAADAVRQARIDRFKQKEKSKELTEILLIRHCKTLKPKMSIFRRIVGKESRIHWKDVTDLMVLERLINLGIKLDLFTPTQLIVAVNPRFSSFFDNCVTEDEICSDNYHIGAVNFVASKLINCPVSKIQEYPEVTRIRNLFPPK